MSTWHRVLVTMTATAKGNVHFGIRASASRVTKGMTAHVRAAPWADHWLILPLPPTQHTV